MSEKIKKALCFARFCRRMALYLALIAAGYIAGNTWPTFEVVPYGYKAGRYDPVGLAPFVEMKDFDDEVQSD